MIATFGNSQTNRALHASSSLSPEIGSRPLPQPPSSVSSAIGDVQNPAYMPGPCQRWWASIGETFTSPGCTQGRW